MVIQGYRIKSKDINEIMHSLDKVRNKLSKITQKEYNRLLSEEITFLVDKVALNELKREENMSIYDGAVQIVDGRINRDETVNICSPFNFRVYVHVLSDDSEYTYLKVNCMNTKLIKAFDDLEEYSVNEIECEDNHNAKTVLWTKLQKKYQNIEPMVISLTQTPIPDKEKLSFESVRVRAETEARHNMLNGLLSDINGGGQIPPIRLMNYFDEAIQTSNEDIVQKQYQNNIIRLMGILPDLSKDYSFIFEIPKNQTIPRNNIE